MKITEEIKIAMENAKLPAEVLEKYNEMKCGCCNKPIDYEIIATNEGITIMFRQSGYKSKQIIVCNKCFFAQCYLNDIVFLLVKFFRRTLCLR